jgi:hypothetical protein
MLLAGAKRAAFEVAEFETVKAFCAAFCGSTLPLETPQV